MYVIKQFDKCCDLECLQQFQNFPMHIIGSWRFPIFKSFNGIFNFFICYFWTVGVVYFWWCSYCIIKLLMEIFLPSFQSGLNPGQNLTLAVQNYAALRCLYCICVPTCETRHVFIEEFQFPYISQLATSLLHCPSMPLKQFSAIQAKFLLSSFLTFS